MEKDEKWKSYFYENTEILKNNLGITDQKELLEKETELSFNRLVELYENPIDGNFDVEHLCMIHQYLFQDIYPWAGKFREVNIYKNNSNFMDYRQINDSLRYELKLMNDDIKTVTNRDYLASFLSEYYTVLLDIHPFRDGNGRTIREFLREFVEIKTEYSIDWSKIDSNNINNYIANAKYYKGPIILEFNKAIVNKEEREEYIR